MNQRTRQVGAELQRALQDILRRGAHDPRIRGLISITEVNVAPDFAEAVVRVSVLPEKHAELTLTGLNAAAGFFRSEIAQRVAMRRTPRIRFTIDQSLKKQAEVHAAINRAVDSGTHTDDIHSRNEEDQAP